MLGFEAARRFGGCDEYLVYDYAHHVKFTYHCAPCLPVNARINFDIANNDVWRSGTFKLGPLLQFKIRTSVQNCGEYKPLHITTRSSFALPIATIPCSPLQHDGAFSDAER